MIFHHSGSPRPHPGASPFRALFQACCLLLLVSFPVLSLRAQTAWTVNPNAPSNLPSNAKLKFANNTFFLAWQTSSYQPVISTIDLKDSLEIPTPYSLLVNYQNMGVTSSSATRKLTLRYVSSTGEYQAIVQDNSTLTIPSGSHTRLGPGQAVNGFVVLSATYGSTTSSVDVKPVFRTKKLVFSSYSSDIVFNDFAYDGTGSLLIFCGSYRPAIAYPSSSSPSATYLSTTVSSSYSYSYSSGTKSCGAYGNGKVAIGLADPSYSLFPTAPYLISASSPGSYNYWDKANIAEGFQVKQMVYGGGKFVAAGARYGTSYPYSSVGAVLISTDGVEWTAVVISGTSSLESVCRDDSKWVVVGNSGAVLTSTNGFEWTRYTVPGTPSLLSVVSANGYCAVGSSVGKIHTTTDFATWNVQATATGAVNCLAAGNGKFMALIGTSVYQATFSSIGVADILTQPASSFVIPQQSVMLSVGAVGSGTLGYQWYQGITGDISQPISGATDSTYQTPLLSASANYWVRVSNALGSEDSQTAAVTMQTPPVLISQPQDKQLFMGGTDTTSVVVAGNNMKYQWYKGYAGDVSAPMAGKTSDTLTLPSDAPGVSYYWVKATNELGSLSSIAMRASVIPIPPAIVDQPLDITTTVDGSFNVTLAVVANGPLLTYQWYGGVSGDTSHPLPNIYSTYTPSRRFAGIFNYWVRVSNPLGYVDSRTAVFTVLNSGAPVITKQPMDITAYVGSSEAFSVGASAPGSIYYEWYAGETGDTSIPLTYSSGLIPSYTQPGSYRYWVRVYNGLGSVDSIAVTCTVKPLGTGTIVKQPLDKFTSPGGYVTLSVTASGSPLSYKWYSGLAGDISVPLAGTSSTLNLPAATSGPQSYWVRVTSGATVEDSQTAVVKVIPALLVITDQPLDGSVYVNDTFTWYSSTSGTNITYQWYSGSAGDTSAPMAGQTNYYFHPPTTMAGTFSYWRRAFSGADQLDTRTAILNVIGRKPFIITQPLDQQFTQGSGSVSLSASPADGSGVSWQWYLGVSGDTSAPLSSKTSTSLSISNPVAGIYSYWVRATNPYGSTDSRAAVVLVAPGSYSDWLVWNGLPSNGTGLGALGASPNDDGVPNLLKYAMGLRVGDRFDDANGPLMGTRVIGADVYLTLGFIQSQNSPGTQLFVQESTDMGIWSNTPIECGPSYDNGDGTMTRTFRSSQPMGSAASGYLRLKASSN